MVERGASTSRRDGGGDRVANDDQDRSGSSRLLPKPSVVATAQGTGNEQPEGAGSSPAPGTRHRWFYTDRLGDPKCPYIRRWVLDLKGLGSIRLHHWYSDDDQRALHDHPWPFLTVVLWGSYVDLSYVGQPGSKYNRYRKNSFPLFPDQWAPNVFSWNVEQDFLSMGSVRYRPARWTHTVRTEGCWTLLWTGPKERYYGFWIKRPHLPMRFVRHNKYHIEWGHPPCSD